MSEVLTTGRRGQVGAIANLRWRMFINSLRTKRGKLELVSRILVSIGFLFGGLGGSFGVGAGAYYFVSEGKAEMLAVLLWPIFLFWQLFPVMATAFTNNPDSSDLLRFPLNYRSYFLIRLAYGSFDPATTLGSLWLLGMTLGIGIARPVLFPWALLVLLTFAAFNLLLMQMIFAWIERWLAQRKTREIMGVLFVLLMLSFQLIGPMMEHFSGRPKPETRRFIELLAPVQRELPPGLAAEAIEQASHAAVAAGFGSYLLLGLFCVAAASLLHLRLRAQFRGENLSEVALSDRVKKVEGLRLGWDLPLFSAPVAAVFEKEVRYLARSGPMLITLIMPVFMLVIFRMGPMNPMRHSGAFQARMPNLAFPAAAAYALLVLTNLVFNNFGADGGGVQFFYASPVRFRQIMIGKNLTYLGILLFNVAMAWVAVAYLYGAPHFDMTMATLAGLLFATPLNFAVGNLLSIYSPKKRDFAAFGRQAASQLTVLASLGMQAVIVAVGAPAFLLARYYGSYWIAAVIFLVLASISVTVYSVILTKVDRIALERRETLVAELCRA